MPLATVLELAGVKDGADQIVSRSIDGMTIGTPTAVALDGRDAMLAVAMNGRPLPAEHGFPVRMVVPGLYGYVSATKWLVDLELTTFDAYDPYWVERGWAARSADQDDVADRYAEAAVHRSRPGRVTVGGVAWAQHRGIDGVEVRVDDGAWQRLDWPPSIPSIPGASGPSTWTLDARPPPITGSCQGRRRSHPNGGRGSNPFRTVRPDGTPSS